MAKEKNLTAVTSVAAADFARAVTSAGASVKATFANVAKYVIESYNGSTIAGSAQSVKSALDPLEHDSESVAFAIGSISQNNTVQKCGGVCVVPVAVGNGTAFSSFSSGMTIATLPSGFRPDGTRYGVVLARTVGSWASASYYPLTVSAGSDGTVKLWGNETNAKTCQYLNGQIVFTIA